VKYFNVPIYKTDIMPFKFGFLLWFTRLTATFRRTIRIMAYFLEVLYN